MLLQVVWITGSVKLCLTVTIFCWNRNLISYISYKNKYTWNRSYSLVLQFSQLDYNNMTLDFRTKPHWMLKVWQALQLLCIRYHPLLCFVQLQLHLSIIYCQSCIRESKSTIETLTQKIGTAIFAETTEKLQYSTCLIPQILSHTAYIQDLIRYNVCTLKNPYLTICKDRKYKIRLLLSTLTLHKLWVLLNFEFCHKETVQF